MVLCYITDRTHFTRDESARRHALLARIAAAAAAGVDYIQLREKDLSARELEQLTREAVRAVRDHSPDTKLVVNSRCDVAAVAGADGVHLRADDIAASEARAILVRAGMVVPVIGVSCHSVDEVAAAEAHGADFALFAPVFEKDATPGFGLPALRKACRRPRAFQPPIPVLALGGITVANAASAIKAGAAGIAGIRLFQQGDVEQTVLRLRGMQR